MTQMRQGMLFRWRDEFAAWLKPEWVQLIHRCVKGGLTDFDDPEWIPTHVRTILSPRSDASIRHDFIVRHFEAELLNTPELRMKRRYGHVLIWVADEAVATIKKIDPKHHLAMPNKTWSSHNILSDAATLMEDMPSEAQQIVIGYTVDDTGTQYRYFITCPSKAGHENHWSYDLADGEGLIMFTAPDTAVEATETEQVEVDEPTGRVHLNEDIEKQVGEFEEAEGEEERRETDDSAR